jgi:hypothetical protein
MSTFLSVQTLLLTETLTVPHLSIVTADVNTVMGRTATVGTMYVDNVITNANTPLSIGGNLAPTRILGHPVVLYASNVQIPCNLIVLSSNNLITPHAWLKVNDGFDGTDPNWPDPGITIMSGVDVSAATITYSYTSDVWQFRSIYNDTLRTEKTKTGRIFTPDIRCNTLSVGNMFVNNPLVNIEGDLVAPRVAITNLSAFENVTALENIVVSNTLFGSSVTVTLAMNTNNTISTRDVLMSRISAPSLSIQTITANMLTTNNVINVSFASIGVVESTTMEISNVNTLFTNVLSAPITTTTLNGPNYLTALGMMDNMSVAFVWTPTHVYSASNNFNPLPQLNMHTLVRYAKVTSSLLYSIDNATAFDNRLMPLYGPSGATVAIRFRTTLSNTNNTNYSNMRMGENVGDNTGCVNVANNGTWSLGFGRFQGQTNEPNHNLLVTPIHTFVNAAITFSPSVTGLEPLITTWTSQATQRYTFPLSAKLVISNVAFAFNINNVNLPQVVDIAAIGVLTTCVTTSTQMSDVYRLLESMPYGDVHATSGAQFSTITGTSMTVVNLSTTNLVLPSGANKTRVYNLRATNVNLATGQTRVFSDANRDRASSISTLNVRSTTTTLNVANIITTGAVNVNIVSSLEVNILSAATISCIEAVFDSTLSVHALYQRRGGFHIGQGTPLRCDNLSALSELNAQTVVVTANNVVNVQSVYAPTLYVTSFLSRPTTFTSTGFVNVTTNTLLTTSTLLMSTLQFQTPSGPGPAMKIDWGTGTCDATGQGTVTFGTNLYQQPPVVLATPLANSGVFATVHATNVQSTNAAFVYYLSNQTPATGRFSWIAMGV